MADTSKANVLIIAPELSTVASTVWDQILADVKLEITTTFISGSYQERAQRYLVAHLLTIHNRNASAPAGAASESIARASVTYAHGGYLDVDFLRSTKYGVEYMRWWHKFRLLQGC